MLTPTGNLSKPHTPCLFSLIQRTKCSVYGSETSHEQGKAAHSIHIQHVERFVMGEEEGEVDSGLSHLNTQQ